jgi:hypothetical protein
MGKSTGASTDPSTSVTSSFSCDESGSTAISSGGVGFVGVRKRKFREVSILHVSAL